MDTEKKIEIAERISKELVDVKRTEWTKWVEYYKLQHDLDKSISFSHTLSWCPMLLVGPKKAFRRINSVMIKNKKIIDKIPFNEISEIFGYIGWFISIPSGFGMWKDEE
jgi:hypothetical protein